jgi:hypothetical protein
MHESAKPEAQRVRRSPVSISFSFTTLRSLRLFRRIWKRPYRVLPQMGNAKEVERIRCAELSPVAGLSRVRAKLNQSDLVRMELQRNTISRSPSSDWKRSQSPSWTMLSCRPWRSQTGSKTNSVLSRCLVPLATEELVGATPHYL